VVITVGQGTDHEDPRRAKSRVRVLAAAVELLRDEGLQGLTIEAVAARSGVAKTTIYRQFENRDALHLAAIDSVRGVTEIGHTGNVVSDVSAFCVALNRSLRTGAFGVLLSTAFDGAERSELLARMMLEAGEQRRAVLLDRLRQAQHDGELPAQLDVDLVNSQLVGPLVYRRFVSRQATSAAWVSTLVAAVLTPLVCSTSASRGRGEPPR
jgi:AcrR family transcriptional regulator